MPLLSCGQGCIRPLHWACALLQRIADVQHKQWTLSRAPAFNLLHAGDIFYLYATRHKVSERVSE